MGIFRDIYPPTSLPSYWRVNKYVVLIYAIFLDLDSNGFLDERDFACLALRATIIEGKGEFSHSRLQENQHIMLSLWEEIAELADFNKVKIVYTDKVINKG